MEHDRSMKEEHFNDKLDILKHISDIKLQLKDDIKSDFVLAKLTEKDKEFIIEMTGNAYFAKRLIMVMHQRATEYRWDKGSERFILEKLNDKDKDYIKDIADSIFNSYMNKIYMTVILNRNVDKNYLINILSGYGDSDEGEEIAEPDEKGMSMLKKLFKDRRKEEK